MIKKTLSIASSIFAILFFILAYYSYEGNKFLNSLAQSQFKFANHTFFDNLDLNRIIIFTLNGKYEQLEVNDLRIEIIPLEFSKSNKEGIENYISHSNSTIKCFAAFSQESGSKLLSSSIFNALNKSNPEKYKINESEQQIKYLSRQYNYRKKDYQLNRLRQSLTIPSI